MTRIAFDVTDYQAEWIEHLRKTDRGVVSRADFFRKMLDDYIAACILEGETRE